MQLLSSRLPEAISTMPGLPLSKLWTLDLMLLGVEYFLGREDPGTVPVEGSEDNEDLCPAKLLGFMLVEAVAEAVVVELEDWALKLDSSRICWFNSLKFDLRSLPDMGFGEDIPEGVGVLLELKLGLGKSLKLNLEVDPVELEEDSLEAMVALGLEMGLEKLGAPELPFRGVGEGVETWLGVYLEAKGLRLG